MTHLQWSDDFSVGVASIDHEHRELIGLINEICRALETESDEPIDRDELLGELFAMISAHFALEEKIMRDKRYDRFQEHKADHEKLLDELREIMDSHDDSGPSSAEKLVKALGDWFSVHFKTEDARLHRVLG